MDPATPAPEADDGTTDAATDPAAPPADTPPETPEPPAGDDGNA
jgi:hypothetical protein